MIPSEIGEPIRVQIKNCSFIKLAKVFSLYADLDIDNAINDNSTLLFELFGIPNPNITKGLNYFSLKLFLLSKILIIIFLSSSLLYYFPFLFFVLLLLFY